MLKDASTMTNAELDRLAMKRDGSFNYQTLEQFEKATAKKEHLIKGLVCIGETSAWIGAPGALKSALVTELCFAVASAAPDWHGRKRKRTGAVVYFALERADLVRQRFRAHSLRYRATMTDESEWCVPIAVVSSMIDMMNPATVGKVLQTIRQVEEEFGELVHLVVFDTFAKLIAAGGGDENKAADQGKVFANIQRLKEQYHTHVALVGHTGKDETRGARGSNAILGDVDVMVTIAGDQVKTATVIKANDAPEGPLFSFKGERHVFGHDEDGDEISVNIISAETVETTSAKAKKSVKLSPSDKLAMEALHEVLSQPAPVQYGLRAGTIVADLEAWKTELRRRGVLDPNHVNPTVQFKRLWEKLAGNHLIGRRDDYVWPAN